MSPGVAGLFVGRTLNELSDVVVPVMVAIRILYAFPASFTLPTGIETGSVSSAGLVLNRDKLPLKVTKPISA